MNPIPNLDHYSHLLGEKVSYYHQPCPEDPFSRKGTIQVGDDEGRYLDVDDVRSYLDNAVTARKFAKDFAKPEEPDTMLPVLQEIRDLLKGIK